jgi:hypothetical protein
MKTRISLCSIVALMTLAIGLGSGCAWSVGGKTTTSPVPTNPTLGQELIDLQTAHEQGAISDEEYETARTRLVEE